jgi:hypothetical protein
MGKRVDKMFTGRRKERQQTVDRVVMGRNYRLAARAMYDDMPYDDSALQRQHRRRGKRK